MAMPSVDPRKTTLLLARAACILAALICSFTIENVWIDTWLGRKSHHRLPSFVPESLGGAWVLVLGSLGITAILSVSCLVLVLKDKTFPAWKKTLTAAAVLLAVVSCGIWFSVTGGTNLIQQTKAARRDHTVTLRWKPSTTKNVQYNVYRGRFRGNHPERLNPKPLDQPTYTDITADNGITYYYVARALDSSGNESADSNEVKVSIPD